jgi:tetratricopeptide (TPR) repeat protein
MTDELINVLGKVRGLKVVGRSSVFRFKGQQYDSAEVGERLQVGALLEGTVRKAGDRLRITTQLINAADGFELWSDRYESEMKDVFDVQDEISRAMVGALSSELLGDSMRPIVRSSTDNPEAYRLYLQGRRYDSSEPSIRRSLKYLEQALAIDPEYAQAHAALASTLNSLSGVGFERPADVMERAREEALRALKLDETISEAHTALGIILLNYDWDFGGAERSFRRAVELNPADPSARSLLGMLLGNTGRSGEGLRELRIAVQLDPLSHPANLLLCYLHVVARDFEAAVLQAARTLEIDRRWNLANFHMATAYLGLDRPEDALRASEAAVAQAPTDPLMLGVLGMSEAAAGRKPDALEKVEKLKNLRAGRYSSALPIAWVYASLGDADRAFEWIDTAVEDRESMLLGIKHAPIIFAPLRKDPRYDALVRRIGFPE